MRPAARGISNPRKKPLPHEPVPTALLEQAENHGVPSLDSALVRTTCSPLVNYISTREELLTRANDLFTAIAAGTLKVRVDATYPRAEAAQAGIVGWSHGMRHD